MDELEILTEKQRLVNQEMALLAAKLEVNDVFDRQLEAIRLKIKELKDES